MHFLRNAPVYTSKSRRQIVFALINTSFAQGTAEEADTQWRIIVEQLRATFPKPAA